MDNRFEKHSFLIILIILAIFFLIAPVRSLAAEEVKVSFLHKLSNFTGTIPFNWSKIFIDEIKDEIYIIDGQSVRIFNKSGMEIYGFSYDTDLRVIYDATVGRDGNILLLSYKYDIAKGYTYVIDLCNFRGEPISMIELKGLPSEFSGFLPNRMVYKGEFLYMAELASMRIVVTDENGNFKEGYNITSLIGLSEKEMDDAGMNDFSVDEEGNILFTAPVIGKAYKLSPDGNVLSFGRRGSGPGRFGIPSSVVADERGNYLVADTMRSVILVFDKDFRFITEFGYRGLRPGNLIGPRYLAIDKNGIIYVSQLRKGGISVFRLTHN